MRRVGDDAMGRLRRPSSASALRTRNALTVERVSECGHRRAPGHSHHANDERRRQRIWLESRDALFAVVKGLERKAMPKWSIAVADNLASLSLGAPAKRRPQRRLGSLVFGEA